MFRRLVLRFCMAFLLVLGSQVAASAASNGVASWYGGRHEGRVTASGEKYHRSLRTAAHRHFPFGTLLKLTNLKNGRISVVKVNDRGPYVRGRQIDLSERAARDLGMIRQGLARVRIEVQGWLSPDGNLFPVGPG